MHMDEIQYTYKLCKLILMKSIHETNICIFWSSKPNSKLKLRVKKMIYKFFVYVYKLEQFTTNLSFTFCLKIFLKLTNTDSSLENLLLKIFFSILTWSKLDLWARLLLSFWCDLEARALKSIRATFKTWFWIFH